MTRLFLKTAVLSIFLFSVLTHASVVVPDDVGYFTYTKNGFRYIFPEEYESALPHMLSTAEGVHAVYRSDFHWTLDETESVILTSSHNQIANGFALVSPLLMTVFYSGGAPALEAFSSSSWIRTLMIHETAHLYQLNVKAGPSRFFKSIFGNIFIFPIVLVPIFIAPNQLLPTLFLEGNSVLNESRFGVGGRLWSGEYRALAYSVLKTDRATPNRLINDHLEFPYQNEKYVVGGYFQLYLAKRFGIEHVNAYFQEQARSYIVPIWINKNFRRHFGVGLEEALKDFAREIKTTAAQQKTLTEPPILTSLIQPPLNSNSDEIFFLTSQDLRSYPFLRVLNKKTGFWTNRPIDLPEGKLFRFKDEWVTAGAGTLGVRKEEYTLFREGHGYLSEFNSQFITDLNEQHWTGFDIPKSIERAALTVDAKTVGPADSTALLNKYGEPVFFRQEGDERILVEGSQPLTRFKGFYSKPVEVLDDGRINFVSATEFGSSLFQFSNKKITRLFDSDAIVDARNIQGDIYLVVEATDTGYVYRISRTTPTDRAPFYDAEFVKTSKALSVVSDSSPTAQEIHDQREEYGPLKNLLFSSMTPHYGYSSRAGPIASLVATFVDPMQFNRINAGYGYMGYGTNQALFSYLNTRNLIGWQMSAYYLEDATLNSKYEVLSRSAQTFLSAGLVLPLYEERHWSSYLSSALTWTTDHRDFVTVYSQFQLSRTVSFPLSFSPYRQLGLELDSVAGDPSQRVLSGHLYGTYDVGGETLLSGHVFAGAAPDRGLKLRDTNWLMPRPEFTPTKIWSDDVSGVRGSDVTFKKVLNWAYYPYVVPLALRRFAPYVSYSYYQTQDSQKKSGENDEFKEWAYGAEFELLALHKLPFRLSVEKAELIGRTDAFKAGINFNSSF